MKVPVASGVAASGERWTIVTRRHGVDLFTFLEVIDANGRDVGGGGFGGPPLYGGELVNTYVRWPDTGGTQLVGRTDPSITRVCLELSRGDPIDIAPTGDPDLFGVRFFAAFTPPGTDIVAMHLFDADGIERDIKRRPDEPHSP